LTGGLDGASVIFKYSVILTPYIPLKTVSLILFTFLHATVALSQVIDLRGQWKFNIDDKPNWAEAKFDDTKWKTIFTPSAWEDEGFHGYDGFAWYRKKFDGRELDQNGIYYLGLGYIDDCDEVFVNGKLVGFSGSMPPSFKTAYNSERKYPLPGDVINFSGENTIAIRVFDATLGGGIMDGRLGIYRSQENKYMNIDLGGLWSFAPSRTSDPIKQESEWKRIMVPGAWEYQGYLRYNGYAWYLRVVTIPENLAKEPLILLLGKIDDFDKAYLNGILIGSTNDHRRYGQSESWSRNRVYDIPQSAIRKSGPNVLEILVEDLGNAGGIYEGPIGIATRSNYKKYFDR
jgi:sialate O-acetylesterase